MYSFFADYVYDSDDDFVNPAPWSKRKGKAPVKEDTRIVKRKLLMEVITL